MKVISELEKMRDSKRMIKYNPAVTRVEECTKAEIGVGALIATGSHGENGKIALLVIRPNNSNKGRIEEAKNDERKIEL
jgi:hypothetical protein